MLNLLLFLRRLLKCLLYLAVKCLVNFKCYDFVSRLILMFKCRPNGGNMEGLLDLMPGKTGNKLYNNPLKCELSLTSTVLFILANCNELGTQR